MMAVKVHSAAAPFAAQRKLPARGRFEARSWWILPGSFVGLWVWVGIFNLIGVL